MIPKYLYHYTSVDGLKAILSSKKIRFKRLDKLNDPYEGFLAIKDIPEHINDFRKYVYVSCWNDQPTDSISLWYIYTKMSGVRIKMNTSMFGKHLVLDEHSNCFVPACMIPEINISIDGDFGKQESKINKIYGPIKIIYENNVDDTYKHAFSISVANKGQSDKEFNMYDIYLKELGIQKVIHWDYENEWRYKICLYGEIHGSKDVISRYYKIDTPEYIDIPYDTNIEEIIVAPNMEESVVAEIKNFIESNNFNTHVKRSSIKINP